MRCHNRYLARSWGRRCLGWARWRRKGAAATGVAAGCSAHVCLAAGCMQLTAETIAYETIPTSLLMRI